MSKEAKAKAIEDWKIEGPLRKQARGKANIGETIHVDDMQDYIKTLAHTRQQIGVDAVLAMPNQHHTRSTNC